MTAFISLRMFVQPDLGTVHITKLFTPAPQADMFLAQMLLQIGNLFAVHQCISTLAQHSEDCYIGQRVWMSGECYVYHIRGMPNGRCNKVLDNQLIAGWSSLERMESRGIVEVEQHTKWHVHAVMQ